MPPQSDFHCHGGNVVRFLPPLVISQTDVDDALGILGETLPAALG